MGGTTIKHQLTSARVLIVLILAIGGVLFLFRDLENLTGKPGLKEIQIQQISSTKMSKAVYTKKGTGAFINWVDINLGPDDIKNIANWINSVPESEIVELNQIPTNTSISAGIVFRFKYNKEIRIQYDLEKIYITRTDIKYKPVVYSINQRELKQFFDTQLKGFYFGEDKVRES